jgi:hypothetical protein
MQVLSFGMLNQEDFRDRYSGGAEVLSIGMLCLGGIFCGVISSVYSIAVFIHR